MHPTRPATPLLVVLGITIGLTAALSCRNETTTAPGTPASAARGGGGTSVTVTAADPDTIPTDTTLTVTILGSGFAAGAKVEYVFKTIVSTKVVATEVEIVSATQLRARTTVARNADIGTYDIAVWSNGKRGVGAERMEVIIRPVYLPDYGYESAVFDINDAMVAVGFAVDNTGARRAIRWTPDGAGWKLEDLGPGVAAAINRWGDVVGSTGDNTTGVRAWIRLADGTTYDLGPVNSTASAWSASMMRLSDDATVLAGWGGGGMTVRHRTSEGWTPPVRLPLPTGVVGSPYAYDLSANGQWVGGGTEKPYWHAATAWRRASADWTPLVVEPNQVQPLVHVTAVNGSGAMAGRSRNCNGPDCPTPPAWTLIAWAGPGAAGVVLAGCVAVEYNWSMVTRMNEAGHMVGNCNLPVRQGKNTRYPVTQVFWRGPSASPVPLTTSGSVWALNDRRVAAGRERPPRGSAYCINPYGQTADGCRAVIWLLP